MIELIVSAILDVQAQCPEWGQELLQAYNADPRELYFADRSSFRDTLWAAQTVMTDPPVIEIAYEYATNYGALVALLRHEYDHWAWNVPGGSDGPHPFYQIDPVNGDTIPLTGAEFSCVPVMPV